MFGLSYQQFLAFHGVNHSLLRRTLDTLAPSYHVRWPVFPYIVLSTAPIESVNGKMHAIIAIGGTYPIQSDTSING